MARDTLFANPAFGWLIDTLNAFPVKRGEGDVGAIKETLRRLKRGALITVFPEGTRTPDGAIGPMRSGVVLLARKARVPLVPTLILGAFDAWPRRQLLPSPSPVLVAHAEPLTPEQIDAMEPEACMDAVRARIVAMRQRFGPHTLLQRR